MQTIRQELQEDDPRTTLMYGHGTSLADAYTHHMPFDNSEYYDSCFPLLPLGVTTLTHVPSNTQVTRSSSV